jgi:hypothetical protein
MKRLILAGAIGMLACSLSAADAGSKDEVKNAAKKLGENSYSWKSTMEMGQFNSTAEGKCAKDGTMMLSRTMGDNTTESFIKGEKGAIKTEEGWKSLAELSEAGAGGGGGGQFNRGAFMARSMRNFKAPAAQVEELLKNAKDLKEANGALTGDLTPEGVKQYLTFGGRRPGAQAAPEPKNMKGSVKFWLKNGALTKYEYHVQGTVMGRDNQEVERDSTTTVEIKDVGTTQVTVPDEAKKKMS